MREEQMGRGRAGIVSSAWRQALLAVTLAGVLVAQAACAAGGTAGVGDSATGGNTVAGSEAPGADVAVPTVTGPVTGGTRGGPLSFMPDALMDQYGYVEEEFFIEGEATAYAPEGELGEDGRWSVTEESTARYKTRILVRRPADPAAFDGSVFVEWFNVTGGVDMDADFSLGHQEILRSGSVYVGVSAQYVGVEGGFSFSLWVPTHLKGFDPQRYSSLSHPGDQYSYDIFSQAAQAIRGAGEIDVLGGLTPEVIVAMGESQSAARMAAYVNAVHPVAQIYDGFLVHSRSSGAAGLGAWGSPIGSGVARIRDDLDVPVLQFQTEGDVPGFARARQPDTDMIRTWEVAGTAHADVNILDYSKPFQQETGVALDFEALCPTLNRGPQNVVLRAAFSALRSWAAGGEPPPSAQPLELDGNGAVVRDERGIARGGVRSPAVDAPIAVHRGDGACFIFGETRPFDRATLSALYPTHRDYVAAVTEAANAAVEAGSLVRADADALIAEAEAADIPPAETPMPAPR